MEGNERVNQLAKEILDDNIDPLANVHHADLNPRPPSPISRPVDPRLRVTIVVRHLTIDHMLLECAVLQESRDEYYTADSLNTRFETIPATFA